jgi:peptidyl-prolyl cis-trans isomerase-like 4
MALLLETIWGDLIIDLDIDGSPELCKNILKLAYARYYTNSLIFSVTSQRFCQLGCPVGDGSGGACIYGLIDMIQQKPYIETFDYRQSKYRFLRGVGRVLTPTECQEKGRVVATLLNYTPDTIGSQFLITTASGPNHALDGYITHNVPGSDSTLAPHFLSLGKVVEDESNVLDRVNAAYTDPNGRPYADIRIIRALVIYDPFTNDDIPGLDLLLKSRGVVIEEFQSDDTNANQIQRRIIDSPSPVHPEEESVPKRISAADVTLEDDIDEVDEEERNRKRMLEQEELAKKEDQSRAVVLEMLGDLPDANIRAPENVLFICKLNPATIDEDLELIFSRFDERAKVEIIRDHDTGASLQYAFAEFTSEKAAAEAYFKMNNALVDDRRIKVDFSQSVAKLWDKYNQRMRMPRMPPNVAHATRETGSDVRSGKHLNSTPDHRSPRDGRDSLRDQKHVLSKSYRNIADRRDYRHLPQHDRRSEGFYQNDVHQQPETRPDDIHRPPKRSNDTRYHDRRGEYNGGDDSYERNVYGYSQNNHTQDSSKTSGGRVNQREEYRGSRSRHTGHSSDRNHDDRARSDVKSRDSYKSDESRHRRRQRKSHRERSSHSDDGSSSAASERRHRKRERRRRDDENFDRKRRKDSHKHKIRERDSSKKRHKRSRSYSS